MSKGSAAALAVPADGRWYGNDGNWSTFSLQVGFPPVLEHVLPGTNSATCRSVSLYYDPTQSTNATQEGGGTTKRAYNGQGSISSEGTTNISFASVGSRNISLGDMSAAAGAPVGVFPLSPFSSFLDTRSSLLQRLYSHEEIIPSLSWAYTAGRSYSKPPTYGSLTLGGYDRKRLQEPVLRVPLNKSNDYARDLTVQIQSIASTENGTSSPLLTSPIPAFIDSTISQLQLPASVCDILEAQFNLTWNSTLELYLLNDTVRSALLARNPTLTFTLGSDSSAINITLPYAAFDLQVRSPTVNGTSYYFPLKRANKESQYILGRVFLQEMYVVADYSEASAFWIAQAAPPGNEDDHDIVSITHDDSEVLGVPGLVKGSANDEASSSQLSGGEIAGIVVAVVVAVAVVSGLVFFMMRRRKRRESQGQLKHQLEAHEEKGDMFDTLEMTTDGRELHEVESAHSGSRGKGGRQDLSGLDAVH